MTAALSPSTLSRILVTADPIGGVWTYTLELAGALNALGIEVVLATLGAPLSRDRRLELAGLPLTAPVESTFRLEWMDDPWLDVDRSGEWLLSLAERTHVDLVHLSSMSHGVLPWPVPSVVVGHSCVLSWWEAVRRTPAPAGLQEYRRRVGDGLRRATIDVAPSMAMLRALRRLYGPLPQGVVVWNGRQSAPFRPWRKEPIVVGLGRVWDEAKHLAALDQAAEGLAWPVAIGGDLVAPDGGAAVLHHARWLGVLDDAGVGRVLARAAIYALPARYEPFGLSVLEAALSGCALVLGDIASLRELWDGTAVFVPPDDVGALRHALERLIRSESERERLARLARGRARRLSPDRMARAYLACYETARAAKVA